MDNLLAKLAAVVETYSTEIDRAICGLPPDWLSQLEKRLRTPEQTAVLVAALEWLPAFVAEEDGVEDIVTAEEQLTRTLDALPPGTLAALRKELGNG